MTDCETTYKCQECGEHFDCSSAMNAREQWKSNPRIAAALELADACLDFIATEALVQCVPDGGDTPLTLAIRKNVLCSVRDARVRFQDAINECSKYGGTK